MHLRHGSVPPGQLRPAGRTGRLAPDHLGGTAGRRPEPVEVYPSPNATALGAAALGRLAIEPALDLPEAILDWTPVDCYEPVWSADRAADYRARWRAAVSATLPGEPA